MWVCVYIYIYIFTVFGILDSRLLSTLFKVTELAVSGVIRIPNSWLSDSAALHFSLQEGGKYKL